MRTAHYITPLKRDAIPSAHVIFDVETRLVARAGIAEQRWVVGVCEPVRRYPNGFYGSDVRVACWTPLGLWQAITSHCRGRQRLVVWSHNLPFDLRVSGALRWLPQLGFKLEGIVLERTAAWASFTSAQGSLLCCDLLSWLPVPLDVIARDMGVPRRDFNYAQADDDALAGRCREDVSLTTKAVCRMLTWLAENKTGPFRPTGSGQSHACWRRRFLHSKVLIHDDEALLVAERTAMWAGRCEAWRHGKVGSDGLHEWDLNLAYCRIADECKVPVRFKHRTGGMSVCDIEHYAARGALLAEVAVTTEVPVVPCQVGERIIWPVGTFRTLLWDPELLLAVEHAKGVEVIRTWYYQTAPALSMMAGWIISQLQDPDIKVPTPVHRLLKHWARTIVGRMALRYRRWDEYGGTEDFDLRLGLLYELDGSAMTDLLRIGQRVFELAELAEADSSAPQVTGWVMSEARRRLWEVITVAGAENALYMDTDSVLVTNAGHRRLQRAYDGDAYGELVHKASWSSGVIHGPRNLELERSRRLAGVPTKATRTGELTFDGEVWRSLKASLVRAELDHVAVLPRSFQVRSVDPRRQRCDDGTTTPYRLEHDAELPTVR